MSIQKIEEVNVNYYLIPWTFYYHLSMIGEGLVSSLQLLQDREEIEASKFLKSIKPLDVHFKNLFLSQREVSLFRERYEKLIKKVEEIYKYGRGDEPKDLRSTLDPNDREEFQIQLTILLKDVFSLMTTSSLMATGLRPEEPKDPSNFEICVEPFPLEQNLIVKIGESEWRLKEAFIIGRTDDGYIGIRRFYSMKLEELEDKANDDEQLHKNFPVIYKSKEKLGEDRRAARASRIHVVIFYNTRSSNFWMIDVSSSETIVEIDGRRFKSIGRRTKINLPLLLLPLGKNNKLWIDPQQKLGGPSVEITISS